MSMLKMLLPLLFVFAAPVFMDQMMCPDNSIAGDKCVGNVGCNGTKICTMLGPRKSFCCDWTLSPCNETRMIGFPAIAGFVVDFTWNSVGNVKEWYQKTIKLNNLDVQIACPIPTPYLFTNNTSTIIAIGFTGEGSLAQRCNNNSDCSNKEFCAPAQNPSYCNNTNTDEQFHNNCIDKSNNGSAMTFCFPDPTFPDATWTPMKTEFGLLECQDNSTCQDGFCDTSRPVKKMMDGQLATFNGICVVVEEVEEAEVEEEEPTTKAPAKKDERKPMATSESGSGSGASTRNDWKLVGASDSAHQLVGFPTFYSLCTLPMLYLGLITFGCLIYFQVVGFLFNMVNYKIVPTQGNLDELGWKLELYKKKCRLNLWKKDIKWLDRQIAEMEKEICTDPAVHKEEKKEEQKK